MNKFLIHLVIIFYFIFPKIDVFFIPGSVTGLRVSDFITLIMFLSVFNDLIKFRFSFKNCFVLSIICILSIISSIINGFFINGILELIRIFQYFVVAYFLYLNYKIAIFSLIYVLLISLFVSLLQYYLVIPNYNPGRGIIYSREFSGLFPTPSEFSYFTAMLFVIYVKSFGFNSKLITFILVTLNGVKAIIPIFLVPFIKINFNFFISFFIFISFIIYNFGSDLYEFYLIFFDIVGNDFTHASLKSTSYSDFDERSLGDRVYKWAGALSLTLSDPFFIISGFGSYAGGGAMDGGLIRLFFEFGLLGFIFTLVYMFRISFPLLILFIFTNTFYDGYVSSTVMPLFLFLLLLMRSKIVS